MSRPQRVGKGKQNNVKCLSIASVFVCVFQSAYLPACLSAHLPTFILYVSFTTYPYTNYTVYRFYEDSWWVYACVGEGVSYILLKLYNIFYSIFIISFTKKYIYFTQIVLYIILKLYYIFYSNFIIYFTQIVL